MRLVLGCLSRQHTRIHAAGRRGGGSGQVAVVVVGSARGSGPDSLGLPVAWRMGTVLGLHQRCEVLPWPQNQCFPEDAEQGAEVLCV